MFFDNKNFNRTLKIDRYIVALISIPLAIGVVFILIGLIKTDHVQNLLFGLGTGAVTSFLVSLMFYVLDILISKKHKLKNHDKFIIHFKMLFYRAIEISNFSTLNDGEYNLRDYLKLQHRWYHDYFKRMIAKSDTEIETKKRLEDLIQYIESEEYYYENLFIWNTVWQNSLFSDEQLCLIEDVYLHYKAVVISIKNKKTQRAFLEFSLLLETFCKILDSIDEFKSFKLVKISAKDNQLLFKYDEFEKEEHLFKFVREFSEIREKNYEKEYGSKHSTKK